MQSWLFNSWSEEFAMYRKSPKLYWYDSAFCCFLIVLATIFVPVAVCPTPVILDNVQLKRGANKQHFFVNYSITYKCRFGYETPQNATTIESTCQTTRTWSMPAPSWLRKCSFFFHISRPHCGLFPLLAVNCGDPIPPVNGIYNLINGTTTFGSQIVHLCNLKHYPVGSIYARCNGKKMWSNNPPICRRECSFLFVVRNMPYICNKYMQYMQILCNISNAKTHARARTHTHTHTHTHAHTVV